MFLMFRRQTKKTMRLKSLKENLIVFFVTQTCVSPPAPLSTVYVFVVHTYLWME
jgi:hypothetical protein